MEVIEFIEDLERLEDEEVDQDLEMVDIVNAGGGIRIPRRHIREQRASPMNELTDIKFRKIFGFSKDNVLRLVDTFREELNVQRDNCSTAIMPLEKLLITLEFLRTNGFHRSVGMQWYVLRSPSAVCTTANTVAHAIARRRNDFVRLPSREEEDEIAQDFFVQHHFPCVRGLIDGTHLEIVRPPNHYGDVEVFRCRYRIRFFTCRFPGSAHDSRIFRESPLPGILEQSFDPRRPRFVLGDQAYPLSKYLLTPIRDDRINSESERRYNRAHQATRLNVDHCFGMLKNRFPFLLYIIRSKMDNVVALVTTAIIFHNLAINFKEDPPEETDEDGERVDHLQFDVGLGDEGVGVASDVMRRKIISEFFNR
ncbi:putative nuclease HARBI1 isoform X2 [Tigriopus californicus]|uniref:putative nuclease HARBI1 isoform X2 n=1 Tax=Tigriopus californicus TaxID=6832 RepID=UPI0027DA51A2|nr:putative nuclease HARBI1 isoform X2 [Tigriopus californicus]